MLKQSLASQSVNAAACPPQGSMAKQPQTQWRGVYGKKAKLHKIMNNIEASKPKQRMLKAKLRCDVNWLKAQIFKARFKKKLAQNPEEEELKAKLRSDVDWLQAQIFKARFTEKLAQNPA